MNNSTRGLRIAVVGGSISGCTAAIELARMGCEVVLFERSGEELKDRGAGIGVPPSVVKTFVERELIAPTVPYFEARSFVRRWRTATEPQYGCLAWNQPALMELLNWGMLYRELRARVPPGG
jgi:2-polyprenyl-6-methoxyphenol hydroxylase-like FAD-dependent oxidoreductase